MNITNYRIYAISKDGANGSNFGVAEMTPEDESTVRFWSKEGNHHARIFKAC